MLIIFTMSCLFIAFCLKFWQAFKTKKKSQHAILKRNEKKKIASFPLIHHAIRIPNLNCSCIQFKWDVFQPEEIVGNCGFATMQGGKK